MSRAPDLIRSRLFKDGPQEMMHHHPFHQRQAPGNFATPMLPTVPGSLIPPYHRQEASETGHHSLQEAEDHTDKSTPRKRQRIQQACKSCGIKRVKCDGQLPCATCVKSGDECEYGLAKKRGPPKGVSRSARQSKDLSTTGTKAIARPEAAQDILTTVTTSPNPSTGSSTTSRSSQPSVPKSYLASSHTGPGDYPGSQQQFRRPEDPHRSYPAQSLPYSVVPAHRPPLQARHSSGTADGSLPHPLHGHSGGYAIPASVIKNDISPVQGLPTSSATTSDLPSRLHERPRLAPFYGEPERGSFVSLPDPRGGLPRPRFRGGTSGILDFPSHNLDNSSPGSTSPSAFALRGRSAMPEGRPSHLTLQRGSSFSGPAGASSSPNHARSLTQPSQMTWSQKDTAEILSLASIEGAKREAYEMLHRYEVPDNVETVLWTVFWEIVSIHWPLIVQESLPIVRGQPRVDVDSHPVLYNAILSLAARLWDTERDGPLPPVSGAEDVTFDVPMLVGLYSTRARYWMVKADHEPSVEAAQALVLMSLGEGGEGRQSSAAQYVTSACRMAFELGLHRDLSNRGISTEEQQARLRLFWCLYILDKTSAATLGRPCLLRYAETDCPPFDIHGFDENRSWMSSDLTPASASLAGQPVKALSHLRAGCQLGIIVEEIFRHYNTVRKNDGFVTSSDETWWTSVVKIHRRLEQWQADLPPALRPSANGPTFQHTLLQQMWWNALRILAHRPHTNKQMPSTTIPPSLLVCTESAKNICSLVTTYSEQHGSKKLSSTTVYCLFLAAMVLLVNAATAEEAISTPSLQHLKVAIAHLRAIGETWRAARMQLLVLRQVAECLLLDLAGTGLEIGTLPGEEGPPQPSMQASGGFSVASSSRGGVGLGVGLQQLPELDGRGSIPGITDLGLAQTMNSARSALSADHFKELRDADVVPNMPHSIDDGPAWSCWIERVTQTMSRAMAGQAPPGQATRQGPRMNAEGFSSPAGPADSTAGTIFDAHGQLNTHNGSLP
ncbi:unnamed protein product [Parajaminaea phylloscopi]